MKMNRIPGNDLAYNAEEARNYYMDKPFEGVAFWLGPQAELRSEQEYRYGLAWGLGRRWHSSGVLAIEASSYRGVYHGSARKWHPNGKLAEKSVSELGVCLQRQRWDEQGRQIENYHLQPTDPDYRLLLLHR